MTSQYKVSKEQGNTFVYEPSNSPNIFSTATESSPKPLMANEKIIRTEKVVEEKVFPQGTTFASANTLDNAAPFAAGKGISGIPTAPPPPPVWKLPINNYGTLNSLIGGRIGHLKKTQTREVTFNELKKDLFPDAAKGKGISTQPLKPTTNTATTQPTTSTAAKPVHKDSALHNLNDKPAATKAEAAHTGEHYTEPHKPSQIKHVKGILKEKVGHITKNAKMESNGKALEAEFEKEKFDYQAYQHNAGK